MCRPMKHSNYLGCRCHHFNYLFSTLVWVWLVQYGSQFISVTRAKNWNDWRIVKIFSSYQSCVCVCVCKGVGICWMKIHCFRVGNTHHTKKNKTNLIQNVLLKTEAQDNPKWIWCEWVLKSKKLFFSYSFYEIIFKKADEVLMTF